MYGKFLGKVPQNTEIVEFPKIEPFNPKSRKFQDESQKERKFPGKFMQIPIFYSALASSFGRDHSQLDISCKDDAHSIKETV